jgi:hypothetical protein
VMRNAPFLTFDSFRKSFTVWYVGIWPVGISKILTTDWKNSSAGCLRETVNRLEWIKRGTTHLGYKRLRYVRSIEGNWPTAVIVYFHFIVILACQRRRWTNARRQGDHMRTSFESVIRLKRYLASSFGF